MLKLQDFENVLNVKCEPAKLVTTIEGLPTQNSKYVMLVK